MQEGQNARQQVVERIRQSTSILVAVGNNPSVDALAASLGLALMLNKMNKHTTAVFSGVTPPAIQFLEPNKTFESNVDALRDFIISLDKDKADRLRYKVEDDVVRIFITPYKTSISEKDLQYSQGDFNVDLIIALGVEKRDDLDKAIVAHGRILHDATVVTINANAQHSSLGALDWNDATASSLCEMLVGMSEAFQQPGILDTQISTALLTGIVAATDRFSNTYTSPRVMTMAAQLMAAGANQQLIATNLEKSREITPPPKPAAGPMANQQPTAAPQPMQQEPPKKKNDGELDITHEIQAPAPQKPAAQPAPLPVAPTPAPQTLQTPEKSAEEALEAALPKTEVTHNMLPDLQKDLEAEAVGAEKEKPGEEPEAPKAPGSESVNSETVKEPGHQEDYISSHGSWKGKRLEPPTLGGTLNATAEEALEDAHREEEADRNKTLLTHPNDGQPQNNGKKKGRKDRDKARNIQPPADVPQPQAPAPPAPVAVSEPPVVPTPAPEPPVPSPEPVMPPQPEPTLAPLPAAPEITPPQPAPLPPAPEPVSPEAVNSAAEAIAAAQPAQATAGDLDSARQAVTAALDAQPFEPAGNPQAAVGAQPLPAMPAMPVIEPGQPAIQPAAAPVPEPVAPPQPLAPAAPSATPAPAPTDLPPLPPMPPLPQSDTALPPAPSLPGLNEPLPPIASAPPQAPEPPAPQSDPGQFKIPGA